MNHVEMFKRFQRLQGGSVDVNNPDPEAGQTMRALPIDFKASQRESDDLDEPPPKRPLTRRELMQYPAWLRDMIRSIPWNEPFPGPQFNPRDVPTFDDIDTGHKIFDPRYSSSDEVVLAQGGEYDVRGKESPFAENGQWWWEKANERARELERLKAQRDEQGHDDVAGSVIGDWKPDSYKTIGVNINGVETEIPQWGGQTAREAEEMARMRLEWNLDPFASDEELERVQNAAGEGPDNALNVKNAGSPDYELPPQQYARGTGNVGLGIFKRAQHLAEGTTSLNYDPSYPGPVNPRGSGSGVPTQQWTGRGIGTVSNFLIPGLGLLTGPLASWATRMLQSGLSQNQVQRAVQNYQSGGGQSGDTTTAPAADDGSNATAPTSNAPPSAGIGIDPFGNPADPGEFWSSDFGRWGEGDAHGTTPGNYNPSGPGGIAGTRGVWGGQTTIPIASDPNFTPSLGWAMPAASGGGAYGGNTMAKIAMHGTFKDVATPEQWAFMQNYLQGGQGGGGSGAGVGGAGRPMTQSRQMGTSDVNPGLKLFHAKQKRKK